MTVDLFIPCFIDQIYPDTAFNTVKLLRKAGLDVNYNPEQTCCGQPAFNSGYWDETKTLADKFIRDFPNDRHIVSPSASCTGFIKNYYPDLFKAGQAGFTDYQRLNRNLFELTDYLVNHLNFILEIDQKIYLINFLVVIILLVMVLIHLEIKRKNLEKF